MFTNTPEVKLGIVAVSRDCFPKTLSESRRIAVCNAFRGKYGEIFECPVVVENEKDMRSALDLLKKEGCNALVVYLGNFGPETSETLLAKYFHGPVMFAAAAEEDCGSSSVARSLIYCSLIFGRTRTSINFFINVDFPVLTGPTTPM